MLGVYPALMASRPGSVRGFVSDATFQDIGTPADLLADLARPRRRRRPRRSRRAGDATPRVDATARVTRSVLWDDVTVGAGAVITECVVADGVRIPAGAVLTRCAIVQRARHDLEIVKLDK